jgi:hypothetical protein
VYRAGRFGLFRGSYVPLTRAGSSVGGHNSRVAAPVPRPLELLNRVVALRPEADRDGRLFYEFSPLHIVRWAQCPRCRRRFWYALNADTPQEELWYHGATLRQQLLGDLCPSHAGDPPGSLD